ncbi:MAG: PfaD family polyunsaturated fatty acid/polyketide biosynthesis protein, partial [Methylococcales bacterium]|nr:PfaD family polyunsaturated fatty acid/polyketide biosynthesis protein [Methylococcales bacterium]
EQHLITLNQALPKQAWGANLIHTPQHPELEIATVDLFLKHHVKRASASAFMTLTPALVKYAYHGLTQDSQGHILRKQHLFGKVSRVEVAEKLMLPAPEKLLQQLIIEGHLTEHETQLGRLIPVCDDITAEADSGGHTDNRPLHVLLPSLLQLRQSLSLDNPCCKNIRIGAAGGLGTPHAVAGAFAMGAAYVLTASINQPCIESGLSDAGKQALHEATETDVMMAAAGDMFELGVKVQVLKKRSLFAVRANQLYDLYKRYDGIQHLPQDSVDKLNTWFQQPIESVWQETQPYLQQHNPQDLVRAEQDEKHKMALIFRWYLGLSSRWAITGEQHRSADYQIWTGPALGAFNRWVKGQYLEDLNERTVGQIGLNLMEGAAVITRANQLKNAGFELSAEGFEFPPRPIHLS